MKNIILTILFTFVATFSFGQLRHFNYNMVRPNIDMAQYSVVDSLPIERIMIHFNKEIDDNNFVSLGDGDYMAPVPHKDNMIIKKNSDNTKAIVLYNSYNFGSHFEFNIKDDELRTILWYEDKHIYCGYIYDKKWKACKYFESRKEFKRFSKRWKM